MTFVKITDCLTYEYPYRLIYSKNMLKIKGSCEITDYESDTIIIRCSGDTVCIRGIDLCITMLDCDEISLSGKITDISFNCRG